jgi:hypothetical protein
VPARFSVPQTLDTAGFRLRMLTVNDMAKDCDAGMPGVAHGKAMRPRASRTIVAVGLTAPACAGGLA